MVLDTQQESPAKSNVISNIPKQISTSTAQILSPTWVSQGLAHLKVYKALFKWSLQPM